MPQLVSGRRGARHLRAAASAARHAASTRCEDKTSRSGAAGKGDMDAEVELLARDPPVVICAFASSPRVRSYNDVALLARAVGRATLKQGNLAPLSRSSNTCSPLGACDCLLASTREDRHSSSRRLNPHLGKCSHRATTRQPFSLNTRPRPGAAWPNSLIASACAGLCPQSSMLSSSARKTTSKIDQNTGAHLSW